MERHFLILAEQIWGTICENSANVAHVWMRPANLLAWFHLVCLIRWTLWLRCINDLNAKGSLDNGKGFEEKQRNNENGSGFIFSLGWTRSAYLGTLNGYYGWLTWHHIQGFGREIANQKLLDRRPACAYAHANLPTPRFQYVLSGQHENRVNLGFINEILCLS